MAYHVRQWLNNKVLSATSSIDAFHGKLKFWHEIDEKTVSYTETQLVIKDCHHSIRIHIINSNMKAFIKKLRLIEKTCHDFANFLEKLP